VKIGLAFSGGGVRAAAFHAGVLLRLADENLVEAISEISTVSGGSLAAGLVLSKAGLKWPESAAYREDIYPAIRSVLTTTDLFSFAAVGWRGALSYNTKFINSRAKILSDLLTRRWGVSGRLADLPDRPQWWINTACLETGKNWRFSKREMGDWQFGRHYKPDFGLSDALAASAAVPYAIGALEFLLPKDGWFRTDPATGQPIERITPKHARVRLWDGGAYENLGLEAMYKPRENLRGCDLLICSDASGPFTPPTTAANKVKALLKGELAAPHLLDVASDQIRALRSRMFMADIATGQVQGALLRMGNSVREVRIRARSFRGNTGEYDSYLSDAQVVQALSIPSGLKALPLAAFDLISRHGYELADAVLTIHCSAQFRRSFQWAA
jgi:NTE family protein